MVSNPKKKHRHWYHEETLTANSSDLVNGIDGMLTTCPFEIDVLNQIPWQDISKLETSPTECKFTASMHLPHKTVFGQAKQALEAEITVAQAGPRYSASQVRIALSTPGAKDGTFWSLQAAKDLLDRLSRMCEPSVQEPRPDSFRLLDNMLVISLSSDFVTSRRFDYKDLYIKTTRTLATAKAIRGSRAELSLSEVNRATYAMLSLCFIGEDVDLGLMGYAVTVKSGKHSSFVTWDKSFQKELAKQGIKVEQLWVAYDFEVR